MEQSSKLIIGPHSGKHSLFAVLVTGLGPWPVVWSLNHADFAAIFELVRVLICHVILCLRVGNLTEVLMRRYWLLLGILRLRIRMDHAWISSNLVWRVLRGMDLLPLVWIPIYVWIIRTMVVAMRWVLELAYHILLVCCCSSWSHIRHIWLVPHELRFLIWEVA